MILSTRISQRRCGCWIKISTVDTTFFIALAGLFKCSCTRCLLPKSMLPSTSMLLLWMVLCHCRRHRVHRSFHRHTGTGLDDAPFSTTWYFPPTGVTMSIIMPPSAMCPSGARQGLVYHTIGSLFFRTVQHNIFH